MVILFFAKHALALAAIFLVAAGAGTLAAGSRFGLALRSALGLALWAHALFFLALAGWLRVVPVLLLAIVSVAGGALRGRIIPRHIPLPLAAVTALAFIVALRPPLAFDEMLYHLPFVRALATSGELRYLPDLRFPVFPQLHELLCAPLFLLVGDVATHLVSLAETVIAAALLFEWGERRAGLLAAALFAGSPIVVQLATITHVDAALTLFVAAGFYCLDRLDDERRLMLGGIFLGTACSVKYLGGYFAAAALVVVVLTTLRTRPALIFIASCAAAALPTTLWLIATTGDPLFPFLRTTPWGALGLPSATFATRIVRTLRLPWDAIFARERLNAQPPVSPFLIAAFILVMVAAIRDSRARRIALIAAGYLIVFSFLPQDTRYLVPLFPLISIAAAELCTPKRVALASLIAVSPAVLYCAYVLAVRGLPPATAASREQFLTARIPEYGALRRANDTVYVCGAEQLRYYAPGRLLGDVNGPCAYSRVLANRTSVLATNLRRIDARFFLVAKRVCAPPRVDGGMELVYEDAAAQLWRVQRSQSSP